MAANGHPPSAPQAIKGPSAENPLIGTIGMFNQVISKAAYWVEDGDHVFRSLEFDVIAGAPTRDEAVIRFLDKAEDLASLIASLPEDDLTVEEVHTALTILSRFTAAYHTALRQERSRLLKLKLRRLLGRRPDPHRGFQASAPQTSSQPQLV